MKLDIVGQVFGRLTITEFVGTNSHGTIWTCMCICGNEIIASGKQLKIGNTKSCGCLKIEGIISRSLKHGHQRVSNKSAEYRAWRHMKSRCYNPNVERYENYGGKGVTVCDRWLNSFENFYADMGSRPSPLHLLDRYPDVNGNYEPSNCRWATRLKTFPANLNRMLKKKSFKEVIEYYKNKIC